MERVDSPENSADILAKIQKVLSQTLELQDFDQNTASTILLHSKLQKNIKAGAMSPNFLGELAGFKTLAVISETDVFYALAVQITGVPSKNTPPFLMDISETRNLVQSRSQELNLVRLLKDLEEIIYLALLNADDKDPKIVERIVTNHVNTSSKLTKMFLVNESGGYRINTYSVLLEVLKVLGEQDIYIQLRDLRSDFIQKYEAENIGKDVDDASSALLDKLGMDLKGSLSF